MTPAATPEALVESLRKSLAMAASDPGNVIRANGSKVGYKGDRCMGGWIADAILAGPLAPVLAELQRVTAERDGYRETHRWNMDRTGDGEVLVCRGYHDKGEDCDHERFVPEERLATATAEAASLRAKVDAKDRAILLMLPFIDYAAGEGLMFVETEDGEHPEMDAADIMAAVAEALGLELGSDAYLSLLPKGYFAIRTALARAATAEEVAR